MLYLHWIFLFLFVFFRFLFFSWWQKLADFCFPVLSWSGSTPPSTSRYWPRSGPGSSSCTAHPRPSPPLVLRPAKFGRSKSCCFRAGIEICLDRPASIRDSRSHHHFQSLQAARKSPRRHLTGTPVGSPTPPHQSRPNDRYASPQAEAYLKFLQRWDAQFFTRILINATPASFIECATQHL